MCKDRHWIQQTISHQETEAVPYYFDFTPSPRRKIESYYGNPIEEVLRFPVRMTSLKTIKPLYADPSVFGEAATDEFGVVWSTSKIDRGCPIGPCLSAPDLSGYAFPDFPAAYRFESLADWCRQNREHFTIIWVGDLWERATFMRGMENILLDLILHPKFVEELLEGITGYVLGTMKILFHRFEFDGIAVSDDYGAQNSLLMSPAAWRRFIKPRLAKIYQSAKDHGRIVFQHSDGHIYPIIGDLIDIGCDILHPIQPEAMDVFKLKREFGQYLTLWGGMRTQDLLVWGTPEEIRDEVRKLKRELGKGGGYIVGNGITIQADVSLGNIVAMIEEARKAD
jgi:uroporphyrinogen decarboxylase